jgi:hypothetical protein
LFLLPGPALSARAAAPSLRSPPKRAACHDGQSVLNPNHQLRVVAWRTSNWRIGL